MNLHGHHNHHHKHHNEIDRMDVEKGAEVNMDFSKGASDTRIHDGHLEDIDSLHIKQGEGTGDDEMKNIQGISRDNVKEAAETMKKDSGASAEDK